ncbi:MAG: hypothetical protein Ct9H90mP16_20920 [Candidatus Poseidoniales archaeon]|nr:MAG: hypothetical protein Ct9H90mP16_20920 [Candidatus Poseidoniales archaeon]
MAIKVRYGSIQILTEADGFNAVIMGRKTWDSLPDAYQPYPSVSNRNVKDMIGVILRRKLHCIKAEQSRLPMQKPVTNVG